jgi:hypothetical protein
MKAPALVTKEVAEALEHMLKIHGTKRATLKAIESNREYGKNSMLICHHFEGDMEKVFDALAYGYVVEKTPIEHIQEYYNAPHTSLAERTAVRIVLNNLGTKIEGVNA